jgi:hypothetical protein
VAVVVLFFGLPVLTEARAASSLAPLPEPRPPLKAPAQRPVEVALPAPGQAPEQIGNAKSAETGVQLAALIEAGVAFSAATIRTDRAECQPTDPISVTMIGGEAPMKLSIPAVLNHPMALALATWLRDSVLPAAAESFGEKPAMILIGGGHECRSRNRQPGAVLSEHATANALDVMGFVFSRGRMVRVAGNWEQETPAGTFLSRIHAEACEHFTTVLGPRADAAHTDHFHLDLKTRGKSRRTRFCR